MKYTKLFIYILIPTICVLMVGLYFGYFKYFEEIKFGSDEVDASRWALIGGLFYSSIGLVVGLIIDLFVWIIISSNKKDIG